MRTIGETIERVVITLNRAERQTKRSDMDVYMGPSVLRRFVKESLGNDAVPIAPVGGAPATGAGQPDTCRYIWRGLRIHEEARELDEFFEFYWKGTRILVIDTRQDPPTLAPAIDDPRVQPTHAAALGTIIRSSGIWTTSQARFLISVPARMAVVDDGDERQKPNVTAVAGDDLARMGLLECLAIGDGKYRWTPTLRGHHAVRQHRVMAALDDARGRGVL